MFKNLDYIIIVDTHPGRYPNNGGEYGFTRRLVPVDNGVWEVEHRTSAEFNYCPVYGQFQECRDCLEREGGECGAEYSTMTDDELTNRYPSGVEIVNTDSEGRAYGIINATGHEPHYCKFDGGCIECYPCGHGSCTVNVSGD
jgi:hypothetical protein